MSKVSRRGMLQGIIGGAIVLGFDPLARSWLTEARASGSCGGLPPLDGTLTTDPAALAEMADDFGHVIHRTPLAVLRAGSVADVVKMVNYARANGIKMVGRGNGHSTFGQAQVEAGIVIDVRALDEIHSISSQRVVVGAGVVWRDLLLATTAMGRTPPVLTDYTELTVGGTLSMGGIGGMSFRHGTQVDNVEELVVVTGAGEVVVCSPNHHKKLFNAVLAGMGLCAIIVRATIKLIPAEERARSWTLVYTDVPTLLDDVRTLVKRKDFDYVRGMAIPGPDGFTLLIEATKYYTPGCHGDDDLKENKLLKHLQFVPGTTQVADRTYFEYCDVVYQMFEGFEAAGLNALPHTWLDMFVPDSAIEEFATQTMAEADLSLFMPGSFILFFAFDGKQINQPMFRIPEERHFFLFDVIRAAPPDPNVVNAILADNRALFEQNRSYGGTHYTISSVALTPQDWQIHFGSAWGKLSAAKAEYDPAGILGGGLNVFG